MKNAKKFSIFLSVFLCGMLVNVGYSIFRGCFWWECVPKRNFHVLDLELAIDLFPVGADFSSLSPWSEGSGEIERGGQTIWWNSANSTARYEVSRFPKIKRAEKSFLQYLNHFENYETKQAWKKPKELSFRSKTSDESVIGCSNLKFGEKCAMVARYQEYVIWYVSDIDTNMTYTQFEEIVTYIDNQISTSLFP